jgi:hypothetical protein
MKGNQYTKGTKLSEDHKKKISKGLKGRDESYKRKSDKWPHGSRCICRECKEKRTNLYNIWKNKVMPFVMVNANV